MSALWSPSTIATPVLSTNNSDDNYLPSYMNMRWKILNVLDIHSAKRHVLKQVRCKIQNENFPNVSTLNIYVPNIMYFSGHFELLQFLTSHEKGPVIHKYLEGLSNVSSLLLISSLSSDIINNLQGYKLMHITIERQQWSCNITANKL